MKKILFLLVLATGFLLSASEVSTASAQRYHRGGYGHHHRGYARHRSHHRFRRHRYYAPRRYYTPRRYYRRRYRGYYGGGYRHRRYGCYDW